MKLGYLSLVLAKCEATAIYLQGYRSSGYVDKLLVGKRDLWLFKAVSWTSSRP